MRDAAAAPKGSAYLLSEVGGEAEAQRLRAQAEMILAQELPRLLQSLPAGGLLMDLGCGSGLLADAVARARPDARVLGLDADALAIKEAERLFGGAGNLSFECRTVMGVPPPALKADVLVMRLVLMHLPKRDEVLRGLKAWIKPGGHLHLIEGDDRQIKLEPALAEQTELLDLMQRVQEARGGSRRLGSEMEPLLHACGWRPLGSHRSAPDPVRAAAALPAVFLPVAEFYLKDAEQRGWLQPGGALAMAERLRNACAGLQKAELPLYHVWAAL